MARHFYLPEADSHRTIRAPWRVFAHHPWRTVAVMIVLCAVAVGGIAWVQDGLWFAGSGKTTSGSHSGSATDSTPSTGQSATSSSTVPIARQNDVPPTRPIRLQVLNGCAMKDMAKILAPQLRAKGFDVREVRRADSSNYQHTIIKDRIGRLDWAQIVADSLGVDRALIATVPAENLADIDVTIIVGADYRQLRFTITAQKE